MKYADSVDDKIKQYFENSAKNINVNDDMFIKIKNNINQNEKGAIFMKSKSVKRFVMVCATCFILLTCIVVAKPKISSWTSWSGADDDSFESFPTVEQVEKAAGYSPKFVEELPYGFKYERSIISHSEGMDADNNVMVKLTDFNVYYNRENGNAGEYLALDTSNISQDMYNENISEDASLKLEQQHNGIDIYYGEMPYLFLPPDQEATAEEAEKMEKGELMISYGSSEREQVLNQFVTWYDSGVKYLLLGSDVKLPKENMIEIAQTIINQ